MLRLALLTHQDDIFHERSFLAKELLEPWRARGHDVVVAEGLEALPEADVVWLHVDLSVVPSAFAAAASRADRVINGGALDLRKRVVSRSLLSRGDAWAGPVVVKTDLNAGGVPEARHLQRARAAGRASDLDPSLLTKGQLVVMTDRYEVIRSLREVPPAVWEQPGLVVERFLPERDPRGHAMRAWVFCGDRERCTRYVGAHPIVKARDVVSREPVEVPDAMRAERARLGLDVGKIDFVVHEGVPILLDANRTPTAPPRIAGAPLSASDLELSEGLARWLA